MKLDRQTPPGFKPIKSINYLKAEKGILDNGIPVYSLNSGNEQIIKLDIVFNAGIWYQNQSLISSFTSLMLLEGTSNFSSKEIAEKLDYLGSYIYPYVEKDIAGITLFCLNKHTEESILLLKEILENPMFPSEELEIQIKNHEQQYLINSQKVSVISQKEFNKALFGANHPYGKSASITDYNLVTRDLLVEYYAKHYNLSSSKIIISGFVDKSVLSILNKHLGTVVITTDNNLDSNEFEIITSSDKELKFHKDDSVQSSLRLGKIIINKLHPDYMGAQVLNLVFGGYFGSRLMNNIREDKGYTYGIGSSLVSLQHAGFLSISTQAGSEHIRNILKEIQFEISVLQNDLISNEELNRAKNYFLGEMLRGFDGPFEMAESFKSILLYGLEYKYFDDFINTINTITPVELRDLAIKYYDYDSFNIVIAGNTDNE